MKNSIWPDAPSRQEHWLQELGNHWQLISLCTCSHQSLQMEVTHTAQLATGLVFFAQGIAWTDCCHQSHSLAHHDQQLHSMNIQPKWGLSAYNSLVLARLLLPICLPGASLDRIWEAQTFLVFLVPPFLRFVDSFDLFWRFLRFFWECDTTHGLRISEKWKLFIAQGTTSMTLKFNYPFCGRLGKRFEGLVLHEVRVIS